MKKWVLSLALTLCMIFSIMPVVVRAESSGQCGDNVYWELDDGGTLTISGEGDMYNYGYNSPWDNRKDIKTIVISDGVSSIEENVFYGCESLTSVCISNSVVSIGDSAFRSCVNLTSIAIPNGVKSIGNYVFENCSSLSDINISESVTSIGYYAFRSCNNLLDISVDKDNKNYSSIDGVLLNKEETVLIKYPVGKKNSEYIIPDNVECINEEAFDKCSNLSNVIISDSVNSIADRAFSCCNNLISIKMPDSVTTIGGYAFEDCTNLSNVRISNSVTNIDKGTFMGCSNLSEVSIPNGVISIGGGAFSGCKSLNDIALPDSVTEIMDGAFSNCSSLTKITIPNRVTNIDMYTFEYCNNLTDVNIPDNVTNIGGGAFSGCKSLKDIRFPDTLTNIGGSAFSGCSSLKDIRFPDTLTSIGGSAFSGCSNLKNIRIPNNVKSIDYYAFSGCSSLNSVTISNGVTKINDSVFRGCESLTSITIPTSVTKINSYAFRGCRSLTSITIPNSVTSVGDGAFFECNHLNDVYYTGSAREWRKVQIGTNNISVTSSKIHYNSGLSYTPVNANPSKQSGGSTGYTYGVAGGGKYKEPDVRKDLKNAAEDFNKAALEYTAAVADSAEKQAGTSGDIKALAEKLEAEYDNQHGKRISFVREPDRGAKKAAFMGYAQWLNQTIQEGIQLNKINLYDSSIMIDYKLVCEVLSKLRNKKLSYSYNGYQVNINGLFISKTNFGHLEVIAPDGGKILAIMSSDPNETTKDLQNFANQLKDVAQDANKKALKIVINDLVDLTGLGELGKLIARDGLKEYKPLTKMGYGNVVKNVKKCYSGYEAVKDILNCTKIDTLDSVIDNPKKLTKRIANLCEEEDDIENAVVNAAQKKLVNAIYSLFYKSCDYEKLIEGEKPSFMDNVKSFFEKNCSWVASLFQCPVDFTVYNENDEMIGYVDGGAVYYNDDIYIEVNGDVKKLYVPAGMKVNIKMTGTGEGELNYIVEEVIYNHPTGRLNYYGLPLSEGTEYSQNLNTSEFANNINTLPVLSSGGAVGANEYVSAEDMTAYIKINTDSDIGGTVLGGGEYAKGDSVELTAAAKDSDYIFNGWHIGDEFISSDNIYRFTALENVDVHAEFMRVYNADDAYEIQMADTAGDIYSYIYKDSGGARGIVLVPFQEQTEADMQIYVTAYAEDGTILKNEVPYSAPLNENSIYTFENIDLENAASVIIKDENKNDIASADYNAAKDISGSIVETTEYYSGSLTAFARQEAENIFVKFNFFDEQEERIEIKAFFAEYDENNSLISCKMISGNALEQGIEFEAPFKANFKLMFWDNNMRPVTETVTQDWF